MNLKKIIDLKNLQKPIAFLFFFFFMWLFSVHFTNHAVRFNSISALTLEEGIISSKQEEKILKVMDDYVDDFLKEHNIALKVHIAKAPILIPQLESGSIFIGYAPQKDAIVYMLGAEVFNYRLAQKQEELRLCTATPAQCLEKTFQQIMDEY